MALTVKQEKFCQLYAQTGNATQAYKDCGYKYKNDTVARVESTRLVAKPSIKARIEELQKQSETAAILTLEQIKERLTMIAMQSLEEEQIVSGNVVEGIGDGCSSARIMKKKASIRDATKALELLAKMKGGFNNDQGGNNVVPIVIVGEAEIKD